MKRIYKTLSLFCLLTLSLSSCNAVFEYLLTPTEYAFNINSHKFRDYVQVNICNVSGRNIRRVSWTAKLYDGKEQVLRRYTGSQYRVRDGAVFYEDIQTHPQLETSYVKLTLQWDNLEGQPCFKSEYIYL